MSTIFPEKGIPSEVSEIIVRQLSLRDCARLEAVNSTWGHVLLEEWRSRVPTTVNIRQFISRNFVSQAQAGEPASNSPDKHPVLLCLRGLLMKIHPFVQKIVFDGTYNRWASDFLSELAKLPPPNLTELELYWIDPLQLREVPRLPNIQCLSWSVTGEDMVGAAKAVFSALTDLTTLELNANFVLDYAKYETPEILRYLPENLESLALSLINATDDDKWSANLSEVTFNRLKSLSITLNNSILHAFRVDASKTPKLQKLRLQCNGIKVDNLNCLADLKELSVRGHMATLLQDLGSDECKFRPTLQKLSLDGCPPDTDLMANISRFENLQSLTLNDFCGTRDERIEILQLLGLGCRQLKYLRIGTLLKYEALEVIAEHFNNLCVLDARPLGLGKGQDVERVERFVQRLSPERHLEIYSNVPPAGIVTASLALQTHPNVKYSNSGPESDDF